MKIFILALCAFILNVPLGIWRVRVKKFSFYWFVAVHLAVPFIIAVRITLHISLYFVPLLIFTAVLGQIAGGSLKRRDLSKIKSG